MKTKTLRKRITLVIIASVFVFSSVSLAISSPQKTGAATVGELQERAAELQEKIDAASREADHLAHEAESLEDAVAELNSQIRQAENQIKLTELKIEKLGKELVAAEKELERQKGLLQANMKALYKRGGASAMELLVASDSFSQFIDEQEYLERLKSGIQESAEKVIQLKLDIQEKQEEQEGLKREQEDQKSILANSRQQQQRLLQKTRGEEARFQSIVKDLEAEQRKAEAALAAALATGSFKQSPVGPVSAGDIIGAVGNTGLSSGPHLHLEVRVNSGGNMVTTNPAPYIQHPPVMSTYVTQPYNYPNSLYASGYHMGIDYSYGAGAIHAIDSGYLYRGCSNALLGTVNNAYGYVAIIQHPAGHISVYAHMSGGPAACNYNTYY